MITVRKLTVEEKVKFSGAEYCIDLWTKKRYFTEKAFLELFSKMEVVVKNDFKHNVKKLVCDDSHYKEHDEEGTWCSICSIYNYDK